MFAKLLASGCFGNGAGSWRTNSGTKWNGMEQSGMKWNEVE